MVRIRIDWLERKLLTGRQPAGNHPNAATKKRRVRRMVNVGLDGSRVDPNLPARFDLLALGVTDYLTVDRLSRFFGRAHNVLLEN